MINSRKEFYHVQPLYKLDRIPVLRAAAMLARCSLCNLKLCQQK